jgi:hypothetical protein
MEGNEELLRYVEQLEGEAGEDDVQPERLVSEIEDFLKDQPG